MGKLDPREHLVLSADPAFLRCLKLALIVVAYARIEALPSYMKGATFLSLCAVQIAACRRIMQAYMHLSVYSPSDLSVSLRCHGDNIGLPILRDAKADSGKIVINEQERVEGHGVDLEWLWCGF